MATETDEAASVVAEAEAAMRSGDGAAAEGMLLAHLQRQPSDAEARVLLADIYTAAGMPERAAGQLRDALASAPGHVRANLLMIHAAKGLGRFQEALEHLRRLPAEMRSEFQVMAHEADLLEKLGDHEREIAIYGELLARRPDEPGVWASLGNALKIVGRTDEAVEAFRKAIATRPAYGKAWWCLSELKTFRFDDADVAAMEAALAGGLDAKDRVPFEFALGKAYEDRGDPAAAFAHYRDANAILDASIPAEAKSVGNKVDRAIATFTPAFFAARDGWGFPSAEPIFIVGMPRSGSTLIEQILASHPLVEGTRELVVLPQLRDEIARDRRLAGRGIMEKVAALDAAQAAETGKAYVERARAYRTTTRPHFVDKLPTNWLQVGLIRLILPNARIIDARRHPLATGFSNFKQNFAGGVPFSYSLESIGNYYRDYVRLMAHFDKVQPGAVHRVINERLIENIEEEVRRLLDYCGLPFDQACLEFHKTERAVRTPSAEQVRRPISRDGVDQWRAFEPWLGPLKDALGDALEDWQE